MARKGGYGLNDVLRLKKDHTAIVKLDGTTTATAHTDRVIRFGSSNNNDILEQTDFSYNDDGSVVTKLAQTKFDADSITFDELAVPRKSDSSAGTDESKSDETGRTIGGAGGGAGADVNEFVDISYGSLGDDGLIPVAVHAGYFKKTSGAKTYKSKAWVAPGYEFQSVAAKTDISIAVGLFDPAIVAPTTPVVIPEDYHEKIVFMPPAA